MRPPHVNVQNKRFKLSYFSGLLDKALEKSKLKYQRSFLDWEAAEGQYTRADTDKEVSRNEVRGPVHQGGHRQGGLQERGERVSTPGQTQTRRSPGMR